MVSLELRDSDSPRIRVLGGVGKVGEGVVGHQLILIFNINANYLNGFDLLIISKPKIALAI